MNRRDPLGLNWVSPIDVVGRPRVTRQDFNSLQPWMTVAYIYEFTGDSNGGLLDSPTSEEGCPTPHYGTHSTGGRISGGLGLGVTAALLPRAAEMRHEAIAAARARFPAPEDTVTRRDAYRHFYWSFQMTQQLGAPVARAAGDGHEIRGRGNAMDFHNNAVARAFGLDPRFSHLPLPKRGEQALAMGCLRFE